MISTEFAIFGSSDFAAEKFIVGPKHGNFVKIYNFKNKVLITIATVRLPNVGGGHSSCLPLLLLGVWYYENLALHLILVENPGLQPSTQQIKI